MAKYSSNTKTPGICDRCGHRYLLTQLREETIMGKGVGNRVCPRCYDEDHPQNFIGYVDAADPQAVEDPRPDNDNSRQIELPLFEDIVDTLP